MKIADILSKNMNIDLQVNDEGVVYRSFVHEVNSEYIAVHVPSHLGTNISLMPGDNVKGKVYAQDAQYEFNSTVLGQKLERVVLYLLSVPSKMKRIQLRDYVRVQTMLPIKYKLLKEDETEQEISTQESKEAFSIDISGGGINLIVNEAVPVDALLKLKFTVKDFQNDDFTIETMARVKRKDVVPDSRKEALGLSFEGISEKDRDILIGFLFRKLLEQRRLEVKD